MAGSANVTQAIDADVATFIDAVPDTARRADVEAIVRLMARISGEPATMWGPSIVGFGSYRYRYESGRDGEMCRIGLSPRKAAFTLYLSSGEPLREDLLAKLGKHTTGKGCLYVKRLTDIDLAVLEQLVAHSLADNRARYPEG